jgi:hypothetical protein
LKVNKEFKKGYILHTFGNGKIALCKVLNEYNGQEEANDNLLDLLNGDKQEQDILQEYSKKDAI